MTPGTTYPALWLRALFEHPRLSAPSLRDALRDYPAWRRSLESGRSPIADEAPWITFAARRTLDRLVQPSWSVFEYGTGGSTLYFARRAARVVSVEHDRAWLAQVEAALRKAGTAGRAQLLLVPPEEEGSGDPADPAAFVSSSPDFAGRGFRAYAQAIDAFPAASFDLVSIDGRARPACVRAAIPKLKRGGLLLLDDAERPHYRNALRLFRGWERQGGFGPGPYLRAFWQTALLRAP